MLGFFRLLHYISFNIIQYHLSLHYEVSRFSSLLGLILWLFCLGVLVVWMVGWLVVFVLVLCFVLLVPFSTCVGGQ